MTYPQAPQAPSYPQSPPAYPQSGGQPQAHQWASPGANDDPNDVVMRDNEGGAPFLKVGPETYSRPAHSAPGQWKGGTIVAMRKEQAYRLGQSAPDGSQERVPLVYKTGKNVGKPIWDVVLTLQTTERDAEIDGDEGIRQIRLDGQDEFWLPAPSNGANSKKRALRLAVIAAGAERFEVGGEFYIAWTRRVPGSASIPPIDWTAAYKRPNTSMAPEGMEPAPIPQATTPTAPVTSYGPGQPQQAQAAPQPPASVPAPAWTPQAPAQAQPAPQAVVQDPPF